MLAGERKECPATRVLRPSLSMADEEHQMRRMLFHRPWYRNRP